MIKLLKLSVITSSSSPSIWGDPSEFSLRVVKEGISFKAWKRLVSPWSVIFENLEIYHLLYFYQERNTIEKRVSDSSMILLVLTLRWNVSAQHLLYFYIYRIKEKFIGKLRTKLNTQVFYNTFALENSP